MKIGIDLTFIRPDHKNGGTEAALKNLITAMTDVCKKDEKYADVHFVYIIHRDIYEDYKKRFPGLQFHVYDFKFSHPVRMVLFQTFYLPKLVKKLELDLLYFPTFQTGLSKNYRIPLIVNPNDIQYRYYPEYFSKGKRIYYNIFYSNSLKKATELIAISEYVKKCYEEHFKKEIGNKMKVIYEPIDFVDTRIEIEVFEKLCNKVGIRKDEDYILCINSLTKHKNLITLIKAFELVSKNQNAQLVLGGAKWNGANEISDYIEKHGLSEKIILTGYLSDEELIALYQNAKLFVTPSLYEGFGMTPIEAANALCPVVSSKETSLYEVTMGLLNYYEPATDENALAETINNVLAQIENKNITTESLKTIREKMIDQYNFDKIARIYLDLFCKYE